MLPFRAFLILKVLRQVSRRYVVKWQPGSFQEMNNSARNPSRAESLLLKRKSLTVSDLGSESRRSAIRALR